MRSFRRGVLLGASGALVIHCWHLAAVLAYYCSWPAVALGAVLAGCAAGNFFREDPPASVRRRQPASRMPAAPLLETQPLESAGQETGDRPDDGWMWPPAGQPFRPPVIRPQDREWEFLRDRPPAAPDNQPAGLDPAWAEFASQYETAEEQP